MKIELEIDDTVAELVGVLKCEMFPTLEDVVLALIDHAQQGVYRPFAWERVWVTHVFGEDWQARMRPGDPYGREGCDDIFQRPI